MEIFLIIFLAIYSKLYKIKRYKAEAYYQVTKNSFSSIEYDKGKYGEYLTYLHLRHLETSGGKFLFNLFIPRENNKTTEIDVLLISVKGLFVFECKNYGGWIFGNQLHTKWTQTLPESGGGCRKEYFYNPIMQNAFHIKHLKNLIGKNIQMHSIIVFSDRCVLQNITVHSNYIHVIHHCELESVVAYIYDQTPTDLYSQIEINELYEKLYPYTQKIAE